MEGSVKNPKSVIIIFCVLPDQLGFWHFILFSLYLKGMGLARSLNHTNLFCHSRCRICIECCSWYMIKVAGERKVNQAQMIWGLYWQQCWIMNNEDNHNSIRHCRMKNGLWYCLIMLVFLVGDDEMGAMCFLLSLSIIVKFTVDYIEYIWE